MFSPGAKGWIKKYFDLMDRGEISLGTPELPKEDFEKFLHYKFSNTGVVFGFPSNFIFYQQKEHEHWTTEEKLKLLLFESHLLIYLSTHSKKFDRYKFLKSLELFYINHKPNYIQKIFHKLLQAEIEDDIEIIINKRISISRGNISEAQFWIQHVHNVFIYIDVLLYKIYLESKNDKVIFSYDEYAYNALIVVLLAAQSDGKVDEKEKHLYKIFMQSAHLHSSYEKKAEKLVNIGAQFEDLSTLPTSNWMFRKFLLDLVNYVILSTQERSAEEQLFIQQFINLLQFTEEEETESLLLVEQFLIKNSKEITFLQNPNTFDLFYTSLSKRWGKILLRNKDKFVVELKQSKELVSLINKSRKEELSKEEKESVKNQFKDLVKTMPSLAIFMLPGGAILLPFITKILPDILPSAFRDNEIKND
jgi:hypothetical protein